MIECGRTGSQCGGRKAGIVPPPQEGWEFRVPGPIQGYVRTTQRQKWVDPRYKRYQRWKQTIRSIANVANVPEILCRDCRYQINVIVNWRRRPRCDADNVLKGLIDALWRQDRQIYNINLVTVVNVGGSDLLQIWIKMIQ